MLSCTKRLRLLRTKSHLWHQILYWGFTPRPHWMTSQTPLLHARQVFRGGLRWLIEPQKFIQKFLGLPLCGMTNNWY